MVYLSLGDRYSGVMASQVLDVAAFLRQELGERVIVIAFISIRQFFQQRRLIKRDNTDVWVFPMAPGLHRWRLNRWLMGLVIRLSGEKKAFCRGVISTNLALTLREAGVLDQVIYDGRGATKAEWEEYEVVNHSQLKKEIGDLEQRAIQETDWRLAVSEALVTHWRTDFGYDQEAHCVIPCTVNQMFLADLPSKNHRLEMRTSYGFSEESIVLIYSGSSAGWQSFSWMDTWLANMMQENSRIVILFLAKVDLESLASYQQFPNRVKKDWLSHADVPKVLAMGDYGLLIREESVTNQVASPTKFAEYLCCGLQVLISPHIGDYSDLVESTELGHVIDKETTDSLLLSPTDEAKKQQLHQLGSSQFSKENYKSEYKQIIQLTPHHYV